MEQLVETLAKKLVSDPESVSVRSECDGDKVLIYLKTAPEDAGRVIGKGGKVAKAIRTLTEAAFAKSGKQVRVFIDG